MMNIGRPGGASAGSKVYNNAGRERAFSDTMDTLNRFLDTPGRVQTQRVEPVRRLFMDVLKRQSSKDGKSTDKALRAMSARVLVFIRSSVDPVGKVALANMLRELDTDKAMYFRANSKDKVQFEGRILTRDQQAELNRLSPPSYVGVVDLDDDIPMVAVGDPRGGAAASAVATPVPQHSHVAPPPGDDVDAPPLQQVDIQSEVANTLGIFASINKGRGIPNRDKPAAKVNALEILRFAVNNDAQLYLLLSVEQQRHRDLFVGVGNWMQKLYRTLPTAASAAPAAPGQAWGGGAAAAAHSTSATTPLTGSTFVTQNFEAALSKLITNAETNHDFVQILFPTTEMGDINPQAKLNNTLEYRDIPAGRVYDEALPAMLQHWGLYIDLDTGHITPSNPANQALVPDTVARRNAYLIGPNDNHNMLRVTRVLKCLKGLIEHGNCDATLKGKLVNSFNSLKSGVLSIGQNQIAKGFWSTVNLAAAPAHAQRVDGPAAKYQNDIEEFAATFGGGGGDSPAVAYPSATAAPTARPPAPRSRRAAASPHTIVNFQAKPLAYSQYDTRSNNVTYDRLTAFAQDVALQANQTGVTPILVLAGNPDRPGGNATDVDNDNRFAPRSAAGGGQEENLVWANYTAAGQPVLQQALVAAYTQSRREIVGDQRSTGATCPGHYHRAVVLGGDFTFATGGPQPSTAKVVSVSGPNIAPPTGRRMDNHYDQAADYQRPGLTPQQVATAKKAFSAKLTDSYTAALEAALVAHGSSSDKLVVVLPLLSSGIYGGLNKLESRRLSHEALTAALQTQTVSGSPLGHYFNQVIRAQK